MLKWCYSKWRQGGSFLFLGCKKVNSLSLRAKQYRNNSHFPKLRHFDASCDLCKNFSLRINIKCYFPSPSCCNLISATSDSHPPHTLLPRDRNSQKSRLMEKRCSKILLFPQEIKLIWPLCSHLARINNMLTSSWPHTMVPSSHQQQSGCSCFLCNLFSACPGVQGYESFPLVPIC